MKRPRTDGNSKEIVENLRLMGVSCHLAVSGYATGMPDVVCGYRGTTHLLEIKMLGGKLRANQVRFSNEHTGCFHVATNSHDAFELIQECHHRKRR